MVAKIQPSMNTGATFDKTHVKFSAGTYYIFVSSVTQMYTTHIKTC